MNRVPDLQASAQTQHRDVDLAVIMDHLADALSVGHCPTPLFIVPFWWRLVILVFA